MHALLWSQLESSITLAVWENCYGHGHIGKEWKSAPCHKGMGPKLNFYIDSLLGELTKQLMQ
jgi:hypothetical protein